MKQVLISAVVAAIVSFAVLQVDAYYAAAPGDPTPAEPTEAVAPAASPAWHVTEALVEDGWVDAARTAGADHKPLAHAENSICYLTKVEIKGIQSAADANSCSIGIDDFTGFWQVTAEVEEGGSSEVRCNARCLVWGEEP